MPFAIINRPSFPKPVSTIPAIFFALVSVSENSESRRRRRRRDSYGKVFSLRSYVRRIPFDRSDRPVHNATDGRIAANPALSMRSVVDIFLYIGQCRACKNEWRNTHGTVVVRTAEIFFIPVEKSRVCGDEGERRKKLPRDNRPPETSRYTCLDADGWKGILLCFYRDKCAESEYRMCNFFFFLSRLFRFFFFFSLVSRNPTIQTRSSRYYRNVYTNFHVRGTGDSG